MESGTTANPLTLGELSSVLGTCAPVVKGSARAVVERTSEDSRDVATGTLFVARRGEKVDGTKYVAAAVSAGATAVLCERDAGVTYEPRIEVDDVRAAWGQAAQALAGFPGRSLRVVGITGTNGKTTVASLVSQALALHGEVVAKSGTLGFFVGDDKISDSLTTPQPDQLARSLAEAVHRGAGFFVMEVSSHALEQRRVSGLEFEVAALTNLSQDHLDFHGTMEAYADAKRSLFTRHAPRVRVLNVDDGLGEQLARSYPDSVTVSGSGASWAGLSASNVRLLRNGLRADVRGQAGELYQLRSALLGQHNLENLLTAWGILSSLGLSDAEIPALLEGSRGVPGRLERCDGPEDEIVVVVDYAHTPDALERALKTLRELDFESVVCVFGCGGDRDKKKRVPMGKAAATYADRIFLTSDNPRTEDAEEILRQVAVGLEGALDRSTILADRRTAIVRAVGEAPPRSVVLIAGKGHEDYQLVGGRVLPFDDRIEARAALGLRRQERP